MDKWPDFCFMSPRRLVFISGLKKSAKFSVRIKLTHGWIQSWGVFCGEFTTCIPPWANENFSINFQNSFLSSQEKTNQYL